MRKYFSVLITILFFGLSLLGCISQIQPVTTTIITIEPTVTYQLVEATRGEGTFLPTFTLAPVTSFATPYPSATSTPLPRDIFDPFPMEFYSNTVKTVFKTISADEVIEENFFVDNTMGDIHFTLAWREGDLDLTLIQPDGIVIDSSFAKTDENISFTSDSTYEKYLINLPQQGMWTTRVSGKSIPADGYILKAYSTACAMTISVDFDKDYYVSGDSIKLSANIEDRISLTSDRIYVHGAVIQVTVNHPTTHQHSFELFDDGYHGDGNADDGIYANIFSNTQLVGKYNFYVQISGITNWDGGWGIGKLPFTREFFRSKVVH